MTVTTLIIIINFRNTYKKIIINIFVLIKNLSWVKNTTNKKANKKLIKYLIKIKRFSICFTFFLFNLQIIFINIKKKKIK